MARAGTDRAAERFVLQEDGMANEQKRDVPNG